MLVNCGTSLEKLKPYLRNPDLTKKMRQVVLFILAIVLVVIPADVLWANLHHRSSMNVCDLLLACLVPALAILGGMRLHRLYRQHCQLNREGYWLLVAYSSGNVWVTDEPDQIVAMLDLKQEPHLLVPTVETDRIREAKVYYPDTKQQNWKQHSPRERYWIATAFWGSLFNTQTSLGKELRIHVELLEGEGHLNIAPYYVFAMALWRDRLAWRVSPLIDDINQVRRERAAAGVALAREQKRSSQLSDRFDALFDVALALLGGLADREVVRRSIAAGFLRQMAAKAIARTIPANYREGVRTIFEGAVAVHWHGIPGGSRQVYCHIIPQRHDLWFPGTNPHTDQCSLFTARFSTTGEEERAL